MRDRDCFKMYLGIDIGLFMIYIGLKWGQEVFQPDPYHWELLTDRLRPCYKIFRCKLYNKSARCKT